MDDLASALNSGSKKNGSPPPRKKKSETAKVFVVLLILFWVAFAGFWLIKQLVNSESQVPTIVAPKNIKDYPDFPSDPRITDEPDDTVIPDSPEDMDVEQAIQIGITPPTEVSIEELAVLPDPEVKGPARQKIYSGEDSVVPLSFVSDLAHYLVENYWPSGTHPKAQGRPVSTAGVRSANQRYGIDLTGFAGMSNSATRDYYRDRSLILNYAFTSGMVQSLTRLYADRLADRMVQEALYPKERAANAPKNGPGRALTMKETRDMLNFYAGDLKAIGAALRAYTDTGDAALRVDAYTQARHTAYASNSRYMDARQGLEMAKGDRRLVAEAQKDLNQAEQHLQRAMILQKEARDRVVQFMERGAARRMDAETLVYVAQWAARRGVGAGEAIKAAAASCDFMASILEEKARDIAASE